MLDRRLPVVLAPVSSFSHSRVPFMPDPARESTPGDLGLLGRIAAAPSTRELFHNTPSGDDLAACLIKHGEFRHFLSLRRTPPPVPIQWVISSGRPAAGIDGLWLRPVGGWPPGIYAEKLAAAAASEDVAFAPRCEGRVVGSGGRRGCSGGAI